MPASSTRHVLLASRLARVQTALRKVKSGDVRAIPTLRLAIRRLRDLLPVLQLERQAVARAEKVLRRTAQRLQPVARVDALLMLTDDLAAHARQLRPAEGRIKQELRRRRTTLAVPAVLTKAGNDLTKVVARLKAAVGEPAVAHESLAVARARRWAVKARAARRAMELKRALADAGGVYVPGRLRPLQRAARRMLRAAELLVDVGVRVNPADVKALTQMVGALQQLQQSEALITRVRKLQGVVTPADLKAWKELDELIVPLEHRSRQLHGQYVRERELLALAADRLGARATAGLTPKQKVS